MGGNRGGGCGSGGGGEAELTSERQRIEDLEDGMMDKQDEITRLGKESACLSQSLAESRRRMEAQDSVILKLEASLAAQLPYMDI